MVANLHFVRKTAPATTNIDAFFIQLPPDTRVTVNGRTHVNDGLSATQEEASDTNTESVKRPELLSQPTCIFRHEHALSFTKKIRGLDSL